MNSQIEQLLDTIEVGAMATVNRDRTPLVTPLHFARMKDSIIWISNRNTRHAVNAIRSGKIEFVVWNDQKQAVYMNSTALVVPEEQMSEALEVYSQKFGDFRPGSEQSEVYVSPIGQLDENSTTQNAWHFIA